MDFVHPGLLAGGLFAALPVVLHLIMRPRPKLLEFPALRFVQSRQTSNRRTLRLRHLLLLALRMGAIGLLAFALARPSAKLFGLLGSEEGPVSAVLVFDTSPRMGYVSERKSRLDAARDFATELLSTLPKESEIAVVDTSTAERVFEADPAVARQRIANLKPAGRGEPLAMACEGAAELVKSGTHGRKEMYVFTDMSIGAWSGSRAGDWARRAVEGGVSRVQLIDVGAEKPENFALGNVVLSEQTPARGRPLSVSCSISSLENGGRRLVRLRMSDAAGGKPTERGVQEVTLGPDETRELTFAVGGLDLGTHQGEIRIDEPDNLPDDNVRYFTVFVRPAERVLVLAPTPASSRAVFFTSAIAPRELVVNGMAPYDVTTAEYSDFAKQEIDRYAAIVLLDPPPLADVAWQNLEAYTRAGGGVLVVLGPAAKPEEFNGEVPQTLLAGKLGLQIRKPNGDVYLRPDADQHPLLVDFKPLKNTTPWEEFPVYRYWQLTPGDGTAPVAPFNDGAPAIVERRIGTGRALTMTTPISEPSSLDPEQRWNMLPDGVTVGPWPFVVLVNGMTSYLVGRDYSFNYLTAEIAQLRLDPAKRFETFLVTRRDSDDAPLRLPADLRRNVLTVPITDKPGNYRAQAGGTADGVVRGFSVNFPADVDSMRRMDEGKIASIFADTPYAVTRRFDELERESNPDRRGRDLFPWLICSVAVALGLEQVLADRFYRDRRKS